MSTTTIQSGSIATFIIKVNGSAIDGAISVHSVEVEKRVNRIARATVVIIDGDPNTGKFDASSSATFVPGASISIEAGYDNQNEVIFTGIITGQSLRVDAIIGSALEVVCRDAAVRMTVGRKSLTFANKKDSDVMSSIIGTYSGLTANVTSTATVWPEQVQYYVTDWDYLLSRADTNGLIVTTLNGTVSVAAPDANTSSVLTVTYGSGLMEFHANLDAINQLGNVKATSWDFQTQATVAGEATPNVTGPGNLSSKTLSEVIGLSEYDLQTTAPLETSDLTDWAKAQVIKSEYSKITGEATFQGTALVDPAKYITLAGLGDRFNGDYFVSGVVHTLSDGNWLSEVSLGLSPNWITEEPDLMAPAAAGLLPGASGLFNGTVKKIFDDPDGQYRILVTVPLFDANGEGIWARLANFYSTSNAGAFFLPEVGDEVVLGFLNEDPRYPVILGSLYSSTNNKPFSTLSPNEKNQLKAIVSKSGIYIQFDDVDKILTITTPANNVVVLSDKDKQVSITDQNQNSLVMSASGIVMKSPKNITIQADQAVNIKGTTGVNIEASGGDLQVKGLNIKETAQMQYSAEGSVSAQVSGGAELTLKGAMVMIN